MKRAALATFGSLLLALAPGAASATGAQLFKCVDGGHTVYQQQACPVTSHGPDAGASGAPSAGAASGPAAKVSRVRPASRPASSAPATPR